MLATKISVGPVLPRPLLLLLLLEGMLPVGLTAASRNFSDLPNMVIRLGAHLPYMVIFNRKPMEGLCKAVVGRGVQWQVATARSSRHHCSRITTSQDYQGSYQEPCVYSSSVECQRGGKWLTYGKGWDVKTTRLVMT